MTEITHANVRKRTDMEVVGRIGREKAMNAPAMGMQVDTPDNGRDHQGTGMQTLLRVVNGRLQEISSTREMYLKVEELKKALRILETTGTIWNQVSTTGSSPFKRSRRAH